MADKVLRQKFAEVAYDAVREALKDEIRAMAARELIILRKGEPLPAKCVGVPSVLLKMFGHYQATISSIADFPNTLKSSLDEQGENE